MIKAFVRKRPKGQNGKRDRINTGCVYTPPGWVGKQVFVIDPRDYQMLRRRLRRAETFISMVLRQANKRGIK